MADKLKPKATPVLALTHPSDSRANIPTAELGSFARPEEKRPATVRYPRDPTLDPQLVWKGKDEQDAQDLEVSAVPIYIQETIDPLALVEELRAESEGLRTEQQLGFFGPDFLIRLRDAQSSGPDDVLTLVLEVTGEAKKEKQAKIADAEHLWVPAVNNWAGAGRWAFLEVTDPWDAASLIEARSIVRIQR